MISPNGVLFSSRLTDYNLSVQRLIHIVFICRLDEDIDIPRMVDAQIVMWTFKRNGNKQTNNYILGCLSIKKVIKELPALLNERWIYCYKKSILHRVTSLKDTHIIDRGHKYACWIRLFAQP